MPFFLWGHMDKAFEVLRIKKEAFDKIISRRGAFIKVCKCLFMCLNSENKELKSLAGQLLQYIAEAKRDEIRLDYESQPDSWITVNGNHIPVDEDKNPIGGQPKAIGNDWDKIDVRVNGETKDIINNTFKKISKKFPVFADAVKGVEYADKDFIGRKQYPDAIGLYCCDDHKIYLTKELFENGETDYKRQMEERIRESGKKKELWSEEHVIAHEVGHAVSRYIWESIFDKNGPFAKIEKPEETVFREVTKKYSLDDIQKGLSKYATEKSELMAEGFAEYVTNDNPRPIAKMIGGIVERLLKENRLGNFDGVLVYNLDSKELEWITVKGNHIPIDPDMKKPVGGQVKALGIEDNDNHDVDIKISGEMTPERTDYDFTLDDGLEDFIRKNIGNRRNPGKLYSLYHDMEDNGGDGSVAVEDEYYKTRLNLCTKGLHEITQDEADEILYDNCKQSTVDGWFREYNHEYKPGLIYQMTQSPEVHNAALNVMYINYKNQCELDEKEPLAFEEFLVTPIKMYRGGNGKEYKKASEFSSYTFDRKVAETFTGSEVGMGHAYDPNGVIYEAEIRPIDTYGSVFENGESEILVPRTIAPNKNRDEADVHDDGVFFPGELNYVKKGEYDVEYAG